MYLKRRKPMETKQILTLYHTGYDIIESPDLHHGRINADFGQGFYLSTSGEFAGKWAKERQEREVIVNEYELDLKDLAVMQFTRDADWLSYILSNRRARDRHPEMDVIIGPISNDTLYETYGLITNGYLDESEILRLLQIGPEFIQVVIKTEKAKSQLKFLGSRTIDHERLQSLSEQLKKEEADYQTILSQAMVDLLDE